jgi:hypothetical protein
MSQTILNLVAGLAARGRTLTAILKELAPYAAIELILPGGTLIAILCWLWRRRRLASGAVRIA